MFGARLCNAKSSVCPFVCLSVCLSVSDVDVSWSYRLGCVQNNYTHSYLNSLRSLNPQHQRSSPEETFFNAESNRGGANVQSRRL